MKENSVNSKNVDWPALTEQAYKLAENARSPEDLGNSMRFLMKSLGDFHGRVRHKDSLFQWEKEKFDWNKIPGQLEYRAALKRKDNRFFTKLFDNIGYLRIPTTDQEIAKERSKALRDSLCKVLSTNPKGMIIDLRLNGGGHVFSMLMGISNILEYGLTSSDEEIRADGFYRKSENIFPFKETCPRNHLNIPVAVITGPLTGSSAEGLAIILKNRPNTILIGEPTAGWVSSVNGFKIDGNSGINLSVDYMKDVKGNVYKDKIQPDILVEGGDKFDNLVEDTKIIRAIEWLREYKVR